MKPNPRDARLEYFAERSVEGHRLLPDRGPLLVAVSGGPDSVALLHFLAALQARTGQPSALVTAHVNHGLRGAESDGDAAFVRDLAATWGLAHVAATLGPLSTSSEESARLARYEALRELAQGAGADRVATAHTADDQAETVLLRLLRGAGLRGLGGMPVRGRVRGIRIVRPLLEVTRDQVIEYCNRHRLRHRVDSSNESRSPARNYLRLEVLPRIRERMNPSAREAILRAARAIREAEEYLAAESRRILPALLKREEEGKISLDAALLLAYPKPLRTYLFRDAVQELNGDVRDLAATHLDALLSLATSPSRRSADLPGGIRARREGGRVLLELRIHEPAALNAPSNTGEPRRPCR
jgi:tRNA(Ile)-lysidine synthase